MTCKHVLFLSILSKHPTSCSTIPGGEVWEEVPNEMQMMEPEWPPRHSISGVAAKVVIYCSRGSSPCTSCCWGSPHSIQLPAAPKSLIRYTTPLTVTTHTIYPLFPATREGITQANGESSSSNSTCSPFLWALWWLDSSISSKTFGDAPWIRLARRIISVKSGKIQIKKGINHTLRIWDQSTCDFFLDEFAV